MKVTDVSIFNAKCVDFPENIHSSPTEGIFSMPPPPLPPPLWKFQLPVSLASYISLNFFVVSLLQKRLKSLLKGMSAMEGKEVRV